MQRIHTTDRKSIRIPFYTSYKQEVDMKPKGIWYGLDWSWHEWCEMEGFSQGKGKNNFEIDLHLQNILVIDTEEKMKYFAHKFGEVPEWRRKNNLGDVRDYIDWKKVSETYSGIEISPYQHKFRLDRNFFWYYGWDCASGCIWNLNAIKSVTQIKYEKANDKNRSNTRNEER